MPVVYKTIMIPARDGVLDETLTIQNMNLYLNKTTSKCGLTITDAPIVPDGDIGRFSPYLESYNDNGDTLITSGNAYEINIKFDTNIRFTSWTNYGALCCIPNGGNGRGLFYYYDGYIRVYLPNGNYINSSTLPHDSSYIYYARLRFTGTKYQLFVSDDGVNFNLEGETALTTSYTFNAGFPLNLLFNSNTQDNDTLRKMAFTGFIYLDGCNIKNENDELVWKPVGYVPEKIVNLNKYYW